MRGEPSRRSVAIVLCLCASNRSRTRAASSGASASNSDQLAIESTLRDRVQDPWARLGWPDGRLAGPGVVPAIAGRCARHPGASAGAAWLDRRVRRRVGLLHRARRLRVQRGGRGGGRGCGAGAHGAGGAGGAASRGDRGPALASRRPGRDHRCALAGPRGHRGGRGGRRAARRGPGPPRRGHGARHRAQTSAGRAPLPPHREQEEEVEQAFEELASGFRAVARDPSLRLLAGLSACSTFVEGAVDVLVVLVAIELLDLGDAGVGWLNGAWAVGGIVGGAAAISLLGRGRLAAGLAGGCLFVGIPLLLMAALPGGGVAGGVGPTPRVGGSGAAIPEYAFTLLRSVPIFAPLSIGTLENISCRLSEMDVPAGQAVVREGQAGDRFYVIAEGEFDVSCLGGSFPSLADGDVFGEIALLRDVPRTATVTARTDGRVFALDRDAFLT